MHPTVEEQLRAVWWQLETVTQDPTLSADSRDLLTEAGRLLRRLEGSASARVPFLLADNQATAALLQQLGVPLADERSSASDAHERNKALREVLATAIRTLPATTEGEAAMTRIAAHLRRRIFADPSLHRQPKPYNGSTALMIDMP